MDKPHLITNSAICNIVQIYNKLDKDVTDEKRIEILSMLMELFSGLYRDKNRIHDYEINYNIQDLNRIIEEYKKLSIKIITNVDSYVAMEDFLPINICVNTLNYLDDNNYIEEFTSSFLKSINDNWEKFDKTDDFISICFEISKIINNKNIERFRDDFMRVFLNILLYIKHDYWNKILTSIKISVYLKDIGFVEQGSPILEKELSSVPVKLFISRFNLICKLLSNNDMLTSEIISFLINRVKQSVPKEYIDDLLIHIVNSVYHKSEFEKFGTIFKEFNDHRKVLLSVCYLIENDFKNKHEGNISRAKSCLNFISVSYKKIVEEDHDALYYKFVFLNKYLNDSMFSNSVDTVSVGILSCNETNIDEFYNFIYSIL